jgi:hypothetical protein
MVFIEKFDSPLAAGVFLPLSLFSMTVFFALAR